ncbi:MAG: 23S rRNA (uracil(1939)-C(5))-methyltransferase RlmD [Schleiferiaceae bacterium]|nr:23S rRNA (uracil(1939)-C(5))-methyltransferase RlmD [Schleiferiaceae bacterium]
MENLLFTDAGAKGVGVAKTEEGQVVFAKGVVPGDVATVRITRKKKAYLEGKLMEITQPSDMRITPQCAHFGVCGGCSWQMLPYDKQLAFKEKEVINNLKRLGHVTPNEVVPIKGSKEIYNYRNKMEFSFSALRWLTEDEVQSGEDFTNRNALGFHVPGMWDKVIDIDTCHLMRDPSNAIRNFVRDFALEHDLSFYHPRERQGWLRSLTLRNTTTEQWMVMVQFFYEDVENREKLLKAIAERFPEITSLLYVVNEKANDTIYDQTVHCFAGADHVVEQMPSFFQEGKALHFKVGPKSFYQTNPEQAVTLYHTALAFAELKGDEVVYDLYTGTGTIALFLAQKAGKVIGIESVPEAIADAKINAAMNGIENATFFAGDMRFELTEALFKKHGYPDVIVTDPPRDGMHKDVVARILESGAHTIVYVSCNSATQARDLELLSAKYIIEKSCAVDMFPQTFHIENIVKLTKK